MAAPAPAAADNLLDTPGAALTAGPGGVYSLVFVQGWFFSPTDQRLLDDLAASPDFYVIGQVQHLDNGTLGSGGLFGVTVVMKSAPTNRTVTTVFQAFYDVAGATLKSVIAAGGSTVSAATLGNALASTKQQLASSGSWLDQLLAGVGSVGKWLLYLVIAIAVVLAIYYLHPLLTHWVQ